MHLSRDEWYAHVHRNRENPGDGIPGMMEFMRRLAKKHRWGALEALSNQCIA